MEATLSLPCLAASLPFIIEAMAAIILQPAMYRVSHVACLATHVTYQYSEMLLFLQLVFV
jgi:hypothetical protein